MDGPSHRWSDLAAERPDLAEAGRGLFYQFGVGLAFLGTLRADGAPRVNPMCPILYGDGLYAFLIPGPKRADLERDPRYAMHAFPTDADEDAFSIAGSAWLVDDADVRASLASRFWGERARLEGISLDDQRLFEFGVQRCLLTRTSGHGDPSPRHTIWRAG